MTDWIVVPNELQHHGIQGQKWGIRRFQNKDGSLTTAGIKRYRTDVEGAQKKLDSANQRLRSANNALKTDPYNQSKYKKFVEASKKRDWAKEDLNSEKIKEKLNSETKKSKRREKLEEEYRQKGMTDEEAAIAAYKRHKTEKILAGAAGLTVAAAAAYVVYRHYDRNVDKIIPANTVLSRIASNDNQGVKDAFYASFKKSDNNKYLGLYGNQIRSTGRSVFQKTIGLNGDLKVASEKTARNVMADVFKSDPKIVSDFKNIVSNQVNYGQNTPKQGFVFGRALTDLNKGRTNTKAVYDAFNIALVDRGSGTKEFYNALKSKGYDAIMDINDKRTSGFRSKAPVIVFNNSKAVVNNVRRVPISELNKRGAIEKGKLQLQSMLRSAGVVTAVAVGINTADRVSKPKRNDRIVEKYRKEHPNTNMTYTEILRSAGS